MNLATIEVDPDLAAQHLEGYRTAVKARHDREDAAIAAGYEALAKGRTLISLPATIKAGGHDEQRRPRLAVARADARLCWLQVNGDGSVAFGSDQKPGWMRGRAQGRRIVLPEGTVRARHDGDPWIGHDTRAIVPIIPPEHRPRRGLERRHILFEAEWEEIPPIDPALIRHLAGDLWIVEATWDLTELERAVLAGRAAG